MHPPPLVLYRSIYRGRIIFAQPGYLLEETPDRVVTATVPGAQCRMLTGPRSDIMSALSAGRERTEYIAWSITRVAWITPFESAYALGLFWNDASDRFIGYYVNLQEPVRRSPFGFDSLDYALDIVIEPDGSWRWKDEDELEDAVNQGVFTASEAAAIRAQGERVIADIPTLLPTGWEDWRPDPTWPPLLLPAGWDQV
jgi:Protein of unknown function (DUF402)